jgi:3-hydroxyisobutyrate dehydrogenase-like beta-hydroxyacid dehydrogenase
MVSSGTAGIFASGPADAMAKCKPLFDVLARRTFEGGSEPEAATAMKIANNFVLGCAIEAMGEGLSLTRKYGVAQSVFYDVMTDGLFNCSAYKVYGKIMVDESYSKVGQSTALSARRSQSFLDNLIAVSRDPMQGSNLQVLSAIAANDAVQPLDQSKCTLVKK